MSKSNDFPLVAEKYPVDYSGYRFLTLICYNDINHITIVDNVIDGEIVAFVLDNVSKEFLTNTQKKETEMVGCAIEWFDGGATVPFSVCLSRTGLIDDANRVLKRFQIEYVTRVIGPLFQFDMGTPYKVKRRKKKSLSPGIALVNNTRFRFDLES